GHYGRESTRGGRGSDDRWAVDGRTLRGADSTGFGTSATGARVIGAQRVRGWTRDAVDCAPAGALAADLAPRCGLGVVSTPGADDGVQADIAHARANARSVVFGREEPAATTSLTARHPVQLYASLLGVGIFVILVGCHPKRQGSRGFVFAILYET